VTEQDTITYQKKGITLGDPSGGTLQSKTKGCCTALFFYFLKVLKSKLLALLENKKTFK